MDSFQEKYNVLVIKYDALLAENEELKSILSQHGIVYSSIKRDDESTAFSSIIYPPIISVPLKSGQININQTIPEKGKN